MADLDCADPSDSDDVERGFIGTLDDPVITAADGHVVWDCSKYDFLTGDAPETAHPSLWRQGELAAKHGLFQVTDGIYQVRGLDLSIRSGESRPGLATTWRDRAPKGHVSEGGG